MKYIVTTTVAAALAFGGIHADVSAIAASSCENLASLALPHAAVTAALTVSAGAFVAPGLGGPDAAPSQIYRRLPAFCRVAATLTPSSDSDIKMEVWLPAANWNGKSEQVGNGAFNGSIGYAAMATALARGYAASSTDTGHSGGSGSFALGHPEKAIDFGWRAVHETALASKTIVAAFYTSPAARSYFTGCSAGGRQGLKEAQRFPADFDGIIAGAPALDWTGRAAQAVRVVQRLQNDELARLPPAQAQLVHAAALAACDAQDGVRDGVIGDPERCAFDPGILQCKRAADETSCLTSAQVGTAKMLYSAQVNAKTKREITALYPGSELGWTDLGWTASARATGLDQFRFLVFKDPKWTVEKFNFAAAIVQAEDADRDTINALDPDLGAFLKGGGKLIQYHGWSDPQISPGNSAQYYRRVVEALGGAGRVQDGYRLFMAPGMGHCGGGDGPNTFDMVAALEQWVEQGHAPDRILASHATSGRVDRTRPLCPYPQLAVYAGVGSTDEAANFVCRAR
jgi:tannase/feruloyl esterase